MPKEKKLSKNNILQPSSISSSSELRRDLVTGDWIVIATRRALRPHAFIAQGKHEEDPRDTCPFEDPEKSGNEPPLFLLPQNAGSDWRVQVIPNKYPAFSPAGECQVPRAFGPYEVIDGRGFHEVVITRDHSKHFALFSREEAEQVVRTYQERYAVMKNDPCVTYIAIFHNHGRTAGATLTHPHSQIIALPIVPPDVRRSLQGSADYFERNKQCVHCVMIEWERKDKERIVFENDTFVAFCPFISRTAFEIRIFPKHHDAHFDHMMSEHYGDFADALRHSLGALHETLENPAYNFFLHTAPLDGETYEHYHWHMEIVPKTAIWAGFELSTGIEISTLTPEQAAGFLRENRG